MRAATLAAAALLPGAAQAQDAPKLLATMPGAGAVIAAGETTLSVTFDRPVTGGSFALEPGQPAPEFTGQLSLSEDRRTVSVPVRLKPGANYVVWLNSERYKNFKDDKGTPAVPYRLTFSTKN